MDFKLTHYRRLARLEQKLLRRYHQTLAERGVEGYACELRRQDYGLQIPRELFVPVRQWSSGRSPALCWSSLERIWMAFEDSNCAELID